MAIVLKQSLVFLYASGCRCSELRFLTWEDCQELDNENARVTIHGKGNKTRVILVSSDVWVQIKTLRGDRLLSSPVFVSRNSKALSRTQIHRVVKDAKTQAGIDKEVSAHWLRHAHASHSLKRGAPLNLVSQSLGHTSLDTTKVYLHADPDDSSGLYLAL
jgi:integrase/recombinase XerD